jgi:flagellar biosynthesis protein FlhA
MTISTRTLFQPTVLLALILMAVIVMMVLPVPAWLLDLGLAVSFALAILMLTVALFIERPLDFSAFPTILLASLMLRLSLNISSTKLIISEGHTGTDAAGDVIEGFASFIMGGNVVLGIVIFCVLLIVNFVVITKGAGRMAEVGARFALDGMPGKQLAIDADMAAGAITHAEARERRESELAETNFFGSLDGASKFVKGDAIAGLLITGLNIVVGLLVGTMMHDMPFDRALETYAILTVGDGLVSQIPAVIISVAAALLLTRGGVKGAADVSFFAQLSRFPAALATVAFLMGLFAVIPGMPFIPFILGACGLGAAAYFASRQMPVSASDAALPTAPVQRPIGDVLDFDDIHIEFSPDLVTMVLDPATGLDARIGNMRTFAATQFGVILPEIRITDDASLPTGTYRIRLLGVERVRNRLIADRVLVLLAEGASAPEGIDVMEPVYGAPARWILPEDQEKAALAGLTVVSAAEVLATHLLEIIKANLSRMLSLRGLRRLLDEFVTLTDTGRAAANRRLLEDLVPDKVPMDLLLAVLRLLLDERVSVRNLPLILEATAEARNFGPPEVICEHVRQRLGFQITAEVQREDGTLPIIQLSPDWEKTFLAHQIENERGMRDVALSPELFSKLANGLLDKVNRASEAGIFPAIVTSTLRRRFVRTVLAAKGLTTPVLSYDELSVDTRPAVVGQVGA